AAGRVSGLDIEGQKHEYLDYALDNFSNSERIDSFLEFADYALSGLPEEQKLELSSYYQLTDLFLTLAAKDMSFYLKNKIGLLHSLRQFLQVNSVEKPELVDLFLNLLHHEKIAADPNTAIEYIREVVSINTILTSNEALSFILETLTYYQQESLFHKLWKEIEQDKLTYQSIILFINNHPQYDGLLHRYLMERFKQVVRVDEILSELKGMLESPNLLANETFKSISIKKLSSAITYNSFNEILAIKNFSIEQESTEFNRYKMGLLASGMIVFLRSIRLDELTVKEIVSFRQIFTKGLNARDFKDPKVKENYLIANALYELLSNPAQAGTYNLGALTGASRGKLRSTLKKLFRNQINEDFFPLLFTAFETEDNGVDHQGLLEYLIRNSDDMTILSFIRDNTRLIDLYPLFKASLKKYLITDPESIWKKKSLRKELKLIKSYSLKNLLKEVETATAGPVVRFLKQYGLKLLVMVVLFGGVGGGAWYGVNMLFSKDKTPASVVKTTETSVSAASKDTNATPAESTVTLDAFKQSGEGTVGQTFSINMEGKRAKKVYGQVENGKQSILLTDIKDENYLLDLTPPSETSPFDENMILREGFTLSSTEHDFTGDREPEIVLAASDHSTESYIWIFNLDGNETAGELLTPLLAQKSEAKVELSGNKLILSDDQPGLTFEFSNQEQKFVEAFNQ
ncbi:MAG: hypothetical protein ACJ8MO_22230, partial [Bacillus sp. (in: firmicutes)]